MTATEDGVVLACEDLSVRFPVRAGLLGREHVHAVEHVDLAIGEGETLGLVGESGCGKSTLAKVLSGLLAPTRGTVRFAGSDVASLDAAERRRTYARRVSMVFQDPYSSLNPRWRVRELVRDPMDVHEAGTPAERRRRVDELLELVGLDPAVAGRLPRQLSGGQRQRVAIARALALDPALLIADEPTSALDVSVKAQILNLLGELRSRLGLSMVFISHDIHAVRHAADRIAVMYLGRIVETGAAATIARRPAHPYTRALFSAVPTLSDDAPSRIVLAGPVPSARRPPSGCPFRTRCWRTQSDCAEAFPPAVHHEGRSHHCLYPVD
jgi:peptide/nickel transport system ATP-binding protein